VCVCSGRDFYNIEVESYRRIQAVPRPPGCEGFVLFSAFMGFSPHNTSDSLILERFGTPMECRLKFEEVSCCESMCEAVHGEVGLCQQLSCIAAVLHLANVTHLDIEPKNMLFGTRPLAKGGPPQTQVALFDFDLAAIITPDPHNSTTEKVWTTSLSKFNGETRNPKTIGRVIANLMRVASVVYLQCAGPPHANQTFTQLTACPYKAMLRGMLPQPGVLSHDDWDSLELLSSPRFLSRLPKSLPRRCPSPSRL